jgi:tellurite resistance protein TerC
MLVEYFDVEIPVYISLLVIVTCIVASILYSMNVSNRTLENKAPDAGIDREIH